MPETEWLLFIAQLPATPSSLRVYVWRRLRNAGAASLQNGVWILPKNEANAHFLERLLGSVRQKQASGQIFHVQELSPATREDILARFEADRSQEYEEFLEQCSAFSAEIEKETQAGKFSFAELEESEQNLQRLRRWLAKIQKRDFFNAQKSQPALAALQNGRRRLREYTRRVYAQEGIAPPEERGLDSDDPVILENELLN